MNERQKKLASYLLVQDDYVSQDEIIDGLAEYRGGDKRLLRSDIKALRCGEFSKIIISNSKGYKIAESKEEARQYLEAKWQEIKRELAKYYVERDKIANHGQMKRNNADNLVEVKTCEK